MAISMIFWCVPGLSSGVSGTAVAMFYGGEKDNVLPHHPVSSEQEGQLIETEATGATSKTTIIH